MDLKLDSHVAHPAQVMHLLSRLSHHPEALRLGWV